MHRSLLPATALALILGSAALADTPEGWQPLLEPAQLAALLDTHGEDIRVVQITGDYAAGHIPGSGWSPYASWRSDMPNPGALRDLPHLERTLRELGIDIDTPVVVVHSGANATDLGAAARVYWTLKSLGVQDLALLNGGLAAWQSAGLPSQTAPTSFFPSDYTASWSDGWRATTDDVTRFATEGGAQLIDSRPADFYAGDTWTVAAPGTIAGAENLAFSTFFDGTRLRDAASLRQSIAEAGIDSARTTVSFCNTGHWAAIDWFVLSELAGVEDVRLYAESMAEYTQADRPLINQPGRIEYAWRATTRWVSGLF
ncbi:MAG: rhodanese-like domain-containing protein [Paracoccaceae bacterium]